MTRSSKQANGLGLALAACIMLFGAGPLSAETVNNWWTGGGVTTNWSEAANWHAGVPQATHYVRFGYKGADDDVPDEAQFIHVNLEDQVIAGLQFDCDGDRAVTLSGHDLIAGSTLDVPDTATAVPTINLPLVLDVNSVAVRVEQNSTQVPLVFGPAGRLDTIRTGGVQNKGHFLDPYSSGTIRIEGEWLQTTRNYTARTFELAPGPGIIRSFSRTFTANATAYMELEKDSGSNRLNASANIYLIRLGEGERVYSTLDSLSGNSARSVFLQHADEADAGHLVFRAGGLAKDGPSVQTTTNTTVEIGWGSHENFSHILWANNDGITGPGALRVNMDTTSRTCWFERQLAHTGGTTISKGILRLRAATDKDPGSLPETGMLTIEADGTYRLDGHDDTIGGLGGTGTVRLDGATLTVTEGVAPGLSVGALTLSHGGALVLDGGVSRFEFADPETHDQVVFTGAADLTLGGTLEVTAPEGFSTIGAGRYTLFELNGGTVIGAFAAIIPPEGMMAMIEIEDDNVVLVLRTGTTILIR